MNDVSKSKKEKGKTFFSPQPPSDAFKFADKILKTQKKTLDDDDMGQVRV